MDDRGIKIRREGVEIVDPPVAILPREPGRDDAGFSSGGRSRPVCGRLTTSGALPRRTVSQFSGNVNMAQASFPIVASPAAGVSHRRRSGGGELKVIGHEAVLRQHGHLGAQLSDHALQARAGVQRMRGGRAALQAFKPCATLPQVDALRGNEHFDAKNAREIGVHLVEPARAMRGHGDMILLIGGGGRGIDRSRRCALLVLGEIAAAVTSAIMKPELSPGAGVRKGGRPKFSAGSTRVAMRRSEIAPISLIASAI